MTAIPVWINGSFEGRIDPSDRGFLLGDGVFDTAVAFRGIVFARPHHLERLTHQAAAIGIAVDPAAVRTGWDAVLAQAAPGPLILRTNVTRGVTERGLWPASAGSPTITVSATPWNPKLFGRAVRLATSSIRRNESSPASRLKTLGYLDSILAAREAAAEGADDALFVNGVGRVACTTIANVFIVSGGDLLTPPISEGVNPGITRALLLESAGRVGLHASEVPLARPNLLSADAVFLTNSVRFLSPALSLDGTPLSESATGKVAALLDALAARVASECGVGPRAA